MPKIQKNKIEQCPKIFIYRDLKLTSTVTYYNHSFRFEPSLDTFN